ncbi:hypothetical protein HID58_091819 [Brassica napus]|uniref:Uncharacterized protein n=1 Tax=Brassica napus TaxID=3708 RepID=A0ABQ7WYW5_BRANA|nr:hypothetical protein HID58_091819 [Brassica napus]
MLLPPKICIVSKNCDPGLHCESCLASDSCRPSHLGSPECNPLTQPPRFALQQILVVNNNTQFIGSNRCKIRHMLYDSCSFQPTRFNHKAIHCIIYASYSSYTRFKNYKYLPIYTQLVRTGLQNDVRGFMLDMYTASRPLEVPIYTQLQPAVNILKEFQVFLDKNKDVVVTIILEDYVKSSNGLTRVFDASGLRNFMFAVRRMPKNEYPFLRKLF